jgi:UPF0042 nucleotide-binding protein
VNEFVVITGLSGGGRSEAADIFEDRGWFVIDNLPPSLIPKVSELAQAPGSTIGKVVLVVGTGPYLEEVMPALKALRAQSRRLRILFLDASTDTLVRRYESSRRRHPLSSGQSPQSLADAIEAERELLLEVRDESDVVVDTSDLNVHELRARINDLFSDEPDASPMQTTVVSFGYKHGLPLDTDLVIDCRFLPNPFWVDGMRDLTGLDDDVRDYVLGQSVAGEFVDEVSRLLDILLPAYVHEGKSYLTIAFGCTGGRHRSVAIAERVADLLRERGFNPKVTHRDVAK